jgi:membrane protease YdiL (CAAX protease family)
MYTFLEFNWNWNPTDLTVVLPIMLALTLFVAYWFTAQSEKIKTYFYTKYAFDEASYKHILFTKITGFVVMGIVPIPFLLVFLPSIPFSSYGLTFIPETTFFTVVWTLGLSILVVPLVHFSAKKPKNLVNYPQIRSKIWTKKMAYMNALGWFLYLFGYEFLFRGVLLVPLIDPIGIWPAIAINVALYSATHIPKGLDETIGAIPLGLVLCLLTVASGTIWIAFLVHVAMAWTNSFTALKYHPEMQYLSTKK